jgi:antirestriction protein ArdC
LVTVWKQFQVDEDGKAKNCLVLRHFVVFNVEQIDPIDPATPPNWRQIETRDEIPAAEWAASRVASVAAVMERDGCSIAYSGDRAFYAPSADAINLPPKQNFTDEASAAATLLHEVAHATGSQKRLARSFGSRFGSAEYAFEELIAEIGSAYLCAECAVDAPIANHADYLAAWLDILKADKKAIFTASSQAAKAAEWVAVRAGWRDADADDSDEDSDATA